MTFTKLPNYVIDHVLPNVSPNAWKVLCFILRKTNGWQKEQDHISLSQIREGTGIRQRATIAIAIRELERKGYIKVTRFSDRVTSNTYSLGSAEMALPKQEGSSKIELEGSSKIELGVVRKSNTQKKLLNKDNNTLSIISLSPLLPDTPQSQLLFERLGVEFEAKGRRKPKRFPSLACKNKFDESATRLDGNVAPAIKRAFEKGIMSVTQVVDFIAKWQGDSYEHHKKKTNVKGRKGVLAP